MRNISFILAVSSFQVSPLIIADNYNSINIQNSYFSKHFHPILYSKTQNFRNLNLYKTRINNVLNTAIKISSFDITSKNFVTRQTMIGPTISISQSSFSNCCTSDAKLSISGGAVFAQFDFSKKNSITISQTCFSNCTATSSGGALFISCNKITLADCCIYKCSAQINQAFYFYGKFQFITGNTLLMNGQNHMSFPMKQTINCHFAYCNLILSKCNLSSNTARQAALFKVSYSSNFACTHCFFSNAVGEEDGIILRKCKIGAISESAFINNNISISNYITLNNNFMFLNCRFIFSFKPEKNQQFSNLFAPQQFLQFLTFDQCLFDLRKEELISYVKGAKVNENCQYEIKTLPENLNSVIRQKECLGIKRLQILNNPQSSKDNTKWIPTVTLITFLCGISLLGYLIVKSYCQKNTMQPIDFDSSLIQ